MLQYGRQPLVVDQSRRVAHSDQRVAFVVRYERTNAEIRLPGSSPGQAIGYPRVSTYGQTLDNQLAQLRAAGCSSRNIGSTASKIESNVTLGLAAADQQIASGRRLDRVRPVADGAGNQPGLAVMTNSGAARPAHRHIARLGQFEQALKCGTPVDSEIAARKGYKRPNLRGFRRRIGRWMRGPPRDCGDARRHRLARAEILGVRGVTGKYTAGKAVDETAHKRGWTADVEVRIGRDADFLERAHLHAPHVIEIDSRPVGWLWRTVTNVAAACGQALEELAHLRRKWMLAAVARAVDPPNLSPGLLGGECVQHGEDWGGADAGADKDHGTLALSQREAAARGAHVENIASLNPRIDVSPGRAMRLALDADAIAILARRARQRIAAQESALVGPWSEPQYDKLPCQDGRQRLTIGRLQDERGNIAAFAQLLRYPQGAEALPRRGRALRWAEPGVAGCSTAFPLPVEQRL